MLSKLLYTILIPFFLLWRVLEGIWSGLEKVWSYWKYYVVLEAKTYIKFMRK